jgi:hypothetical protein
MHPQPHESALIQAGPPGVGLDSVRFPHDSPTCAAAPPLDAGAHDVDMAKLTTPPHLLPPSAPLRSMASQKINTARRREAEGARLRAEAVALLAEADRREAAAAEAIRSEPLTDDERADITPWLDQIEADRLVYLDPAAAAELATDDTGQLDDVPAEARPIVRRLLHQARLDAPVPWLGADDHGQRRHGLLA